MQNVTQALFIAASVILGVILLATLIYVFRMGGSVNKTYDETQLTYQTEAFNYQFEIYQKDDNTVVDMITLLNLAYSTNVANGYDVNNYVTIVVKVGNKTFQIPKDTSATNAETFYNNNYNKLERNQVYYVTGNKIISVYDLMNKTLNDLGVADSGIVNLTGSTSSDKLSKIHIGEFIYFPDGSATPTTETNGTTYKYIFDCDDDKMTYNKSTGKISKMEFTCKLNEYWELGDSSSNEWD